MVVSQRRRGKTVSLPMFRAVQAIRDSPPPTPVHFSPRLRQSLIPHTDTDPLRLGSPASRACLQSEGGYGSQEESQPHLGTRSQASIDENPFPEGD